MKYKDCNKLGMLVCMLGCLTTTVAHYVDAWVVGYVISVFAGLLFAAIFYGD